MSNTILIKQSAFANAVPSTANVALGELAINTHDGRLYTKIDTGTPAIYELTQNQPITATGNVTGVSVNGVGHTNIALTLSNTGVTAGTYGGTAGPTSNIGVFTVDQYGRITSASNAQISTSSLANGTANIEIYANGNISINPGGSSNVVVISTTGQYVTGVISANGNVTGGNITTGGQVSATGNITGNYFFGNGSQLTGVAATSVDANNLIGNTLSSNVIFSSLTTVGTLTSLSVSGNTDSGNLFTSGVVSATGNVTAGNVNAAGLSLSGNVLSAINSTSNITTTGEITGGNISTAGNIAGNNITGTLTTANQPNITDVGVLNSLLVANTVLADGYSARTGSNLPISVLGANASILIQPNGTGVTDFNNKPIANISTVSASGNIAGGNISTAGNVAANGVLTDNYYYANGTPVDFQQAAGSNTQLQFNNNNDFGASANLTFDSATNLLTVTGTASVTANVIGGNLLTGGLVSATGNVIASNLVTSGIADVTGNVAAGNVNTGGAVSASGNIIGANFSTGGAVTATGNVTGGNVFTGGVMSAGGNVTGANIVTGGLISATGNATVGNVSTGIVTATGNVTAGNLSTGGIVSATGNIIGGNVSTGAVSASGNVDAANYFTSGVVSATGNVTGGNIFATVGVVTGNITSIADLSISTGNGDLNLYPTAGNINLGNRYINGLQLNPVQDSDAASKYYVDLIASTALVYHEAVVAATTANLATTTGGTITYAQPNGAGNGIGATITTTGSFNLIDSANVQTANTRILVKDEGNAVLNGIYVWSNATVITRAPDADTFGPGDQELSLNNYFFVSSGNVNLGSAWVVDAPEGVITFGTSNIQFAQFSQAQVYSANTSAGLSLNGQTFAAKVDNNTTAFDGSGNIIVKASANLTTPNIGAATGTSLSVTGNISSGNVNFDAGVISGTGNVIAGNAQISGLVSVTGNVTAGNVSTAIVSASGNVTGANFLTVGLISATGNVTGGNVYVDATANVANLVVRTLANIVSTTVSTSNTTGALQVAGGIGVTGNVYADGMYVFGDSVLTVNSTIDGGTY